MKTIPIKTEKEIEIMKECGAIAAQVKKELVKAAKPGITTIELDKLAEKLIRDKGAVPGFKGYNGYPASIVTCVNKEAIHAIPGDRRLKKKDLLTIDLGVFYRGFHTDTAVSFAVGEANLKSQISNLKSFLRVGQRALEKAINQVRPGNHIGDISHAIQQTIESAGYNVIRAFVGHGVGKKLHEPPSIPCFGKAGIGEKIKIGMTLAIEVMYVFDSPELEILDNGWTAVTKDRGLSAMFEQTVAVTKRGPLVLT